jgi:cell division protein FtsL
MKNSKPLLLYGLMAGVVVTLYALTYVGIKLKCDSLVKEKIITQENLSTANNEHLNLIAQFQNLNSEERITAIAQNELGMIKGSAPALTLSVSREKIERLQQEINSKYEEFKSINIINICFYIFPGHRCQAL